jgi:hypothetical protein
MSVDGSGEDPAAGSPETAEAAACTGGITAAAPAAKSAVSFRKERRVRDAVMIGSPFLKQKEYSADYTPAGAAKQCRKEKRGDARKTTSTLSTLSTVLVWISVL